MTSPIWQQLDPAQQALVHLVDTAMLAHQLAATATSTQTGAHDYTLQPDPEDPLVLELVLERLDDETALVQALTVAHGTGWELSHGHSRLHTWTINGRQVVLRAESDSLIFRIHPAAD